MLRLLLALLCIFGPVAAAAAQLPSTLAPPAPFPQILTDAPTLSFVAPGVTSGDYELWTIDGPLSIHVVSVDLHAPDVRIDTALASDRLSSTGETVSAMAARTGAIAGINGDYFDINNTNAPLNILVEGGRLIKTPMKRYALGLTREKQIEFAEFAFAGNLQLADGSTVQLDGVNDWPPPKGGTSLLTPEFGEVPPVPNLTLVQLQPLTGSPPFAGYRVKGVVDNAQAQPPGYYLGIGVNAYGNAGDVNAGDTIAIQASATPPLDDLLAAVGGGPLLVDNGAAYADPDGPSGGEFDTRIPSSGAAVTSDGTLLLIVVDGRQPALSIGLTRAQFGSLMLAFGAVQGMALDGGGSSTLVARQLGQSRAVVQNSPSDGTQRRVGDALLVYSDAPQGPPARIAMQPQFVRAFVGARVALSDATTDAAGHPVDSTRTLRIRAIPGDLGAIEGETFVAGKAARTGILHVERGSLTADVPVHVVDDAARLELLPKDPNVSPNGRVRVTARAFDRSGYPIVLPPHLQWTASNGRIAPDGTFQAATSDATVSVRIAGAVADERVTVGQHESPVQLGGHVAFATIPRGGPGSLAFGAPCPACVSLSYDFTGTQRAAYIQGHVPLPDGALGFSFDVDGDGNGEVLRVALVNAINERVALTAGKITWNGWRHVVVKFPASLAQPASLKSLYVLNALGGPPVMRAGTVAFRNVRVILAGSGDSGNN
ncbi:MAG TPA: phosphodiester glycosidase family protein [Candidatus Baltobacteraceae bacterium]